MEWKTTLKQYLDVVTKQIVLLDIYKFTNLVEWVCLRYTIAVSHAYWTF